MVVLAQPFVEQFVSVRARWTVEHHLRFKIQRGQLSSPTPYFETDRLQVEHRE
jgi:hypothetical protein